MANRKKKYQSDLKMYKISVKLSEKDMAKLNDEIKTTNTTISKYVRELIQTGGNVDAKYPEDRIKLIRQITGIAANINQITKLANAKGCVYFSEIQELKESMAEIQQLLRGVMNIWQLQRS